MSIAPETNPIRPRKLQFSLRGLLFFAVVCACAASYWFAMRQTNEMNRLKAENEKIRTQFGDLTIEPGSEDKLHVVAVPSRSAVLRNLEWKWRVYVPPGAYVCTAKSELELRKSPSRFDDPFESGVVSVELHRDPVEGWSWSVGTPRYFTRIPIRGAARDAHDFEISLVHPIPVGTIVADLGVPLQLLGVVAVPVDKDGVRHHDDRKFLELWIVQKTPTGTPSKK